MQTATIVAVLCALACVHGAQAGLGIGPCPQSRKPMSNFHLARYAGLWYQTNGFGNIFELNGKCSQANYTPNNSGGVDVRNVMLDKSSLEKKEIKGSAKLEDNSGSAKFQVTLDVGGIAGNRTAPLWVLGTDYENYSVAYSCVNFYVLHYEFGWILSRSAQMNEQTQNKVNEVLSANGLSASQFSAVVQDCGPL